VSGVGVKGPYANMSRMLVNLLVSSNRSVPSLHINPNQFIHLQSCCLLEQPFLTTLFQNNLAFITQVCFCWKPSSANGFISVNNLTCLPKFALRNVLTNDCLTSTPRHPQCSPRVNNFIKNARKNLLHKSLYTTLNSPQCIINHC
jgi:hypothetical protein